MNFEYSPYLLIHISKSRWQAHRTTYIHKAHKNNIYANVQDKSCVSCDVKSIALYAYYSLKSIKSSDEIGGTFNISTIDNEIASHVSVILYLW